MDKNIEDFYRSCIMGIQFQRRIQRGGSNYIVQIREPKGISETSEEELKKLTDILVNRYG
jgi:hypothetical protein